LGRGDNQEVLNDVLDILIAGVTSGAVQVLSVRSSGDFTGQYKDSTELVTEADRRSDAAILGVFESRFRALDPGIGLRLEESGSTGPQGARWVGADPLDGTNHFAAGGVSYCIQAHYVEDGVPQVGVVFQPEVYLPLFESVHCTGRLVYAIKDHGAFVQRTEFTGVDFARSAPRRVEKPAFIDVKGFVACVPLSTKMAPEEWKRAERVLESGVVAVTTGVGCAGGNVMMTIFGGQHVYANLGAGEDLDLIPPQAIAIEAGLTVWGVDRKPPVWKVRKQPLIVAPTPGIAEQFLQAAGF
jgi:3'-phosphoadenosine 5'-phosphosulfate (PAPS) 3'-phosphatase